MPILHPKLNRRWFSVAVASWMALSCTILGSSPLSALERASVDRPSRAERPLPPQVSFKSSKLSVTDPQGDTLGITQPQIDISFFSAQVFGNNMTIDVQFFGSVSLPTSGLPNAFDGFIDIDADQNGNTGALPWVDALTGTEITGMGGEYYVDFLTYDSSDGSVDLVETVGETTVGRCPTTIQENNLRVSIPLSLLGGDQNVNTAIVIGTRTEVLNDIAPNGGSVASSPDTSNAVFLHDGRFKVELSWRNFEGQTGVGLPVFRSTDSVLLYFFVPDNWEMVAKVINACTFNNRFWVFASASTNVQYRLTVTDTLSGAVKSYDNPLGRASAAITDTEAFATCP